MTDFKFGLRMAWAALSYRITYPVWVWLLGAVLSGIISATLREMGWG